MRQSTRDKRNYVIVGLLLLVLFMTVGFAAFSTSLQINGTADISTNWCVGFDNTKTSTYEITKGKSTGTTPSATMEYDGTACSSTYVPIANLGAVFYQPGDKIEYTLTIANKGSVDAAIESITVDGASVTSNQTKQKGNIIWKVYMPEATTLPAGTGTTTMVVSAEFQNKTDLTNYTSNERQTIAIGVNAVQGTNGMTITPAAPAILYSVNVDTNLGQSINELNNQSLYCGFSETHGLSLCYNTEEQCITEMQSYDPDAHCSIFNTVTDNLAQLARNNSSSCYLKHTIDDNKVESTELCFRNPDFCLKPNDYENSKNLIQTHMAWQGCNEYDDKFQCGTPSGGTAYFAQKDGTVGIAMYSWHCWLLGDGSSSCSW